MGRENFINNTAFISYSRADIDVAIDLEKKLEKYPYPQNMVAKENRPYDPRLVRPIFLDVLDLPVKTSPFSKDIQENLRHSKYLIVICSVNSASSKYVRKEIDYFLETHENNEDLIVAVYVDKIFAGMHPVIDKIVASRNCPIYVTGRGEAGQVGRKYCFYHVLEFLLKVDFDKLYNRYEAYQRRKKTRRMYMAGIVLALVFALMTWGLISEYRRAQIEHARVRFERGIFPYALVVGYVNNFLSPTMKYLNDSLPESRAHMFVYMPSDSTDLVDSTRVGKYTKYLQQHYPFDGYAMEHITIPKRDRGASITRMKFIDSNIPIYKDDAKTIVAFNYVIDYKLGPDNPRRIQKENPRNFYTDLYTDSFIVYTRNLLPEYKSQLHFVRDTLEFGRILDSLFVAEPK